jgi:hypothetical protein
MKKVILSILILTITVTTSISAAAGPSLSSGYITMTGMPVAVTDEEISGLKSVSGSTIGIMYLIAIGDASTETLTKRAGITKVKYIDKKVLDIAGIFRQETFTIYGE